VPPSSAFIAQLPDANEFSIEEAMIDTWVEDTSVYLRLESNEITPLEALPPDQA
jgi:hypothetical protein